METRMQDQRLWEAILSARIEISAGPGTLESTVRAACRLDAREYRHVLREYQKFLYLLTVTGQSLRPSAVIDFIWQAHSGEAIPTMEAQFSSSAWPPKYVKGTRFRGWDPDYEATLQAYDQVFGPTPSQLIWPTIRRLRGLAAIMALSFAAVPAMVAGVKFGGYWEVLLPIGLIVMFCLLPIAIVFDPWADRRDP
jgi:hypothetical protein